MMTSLAVLIKHSKAAAGGIAAAAAIALVLTGCATGAGPGSDAESTQVPETTIPEPTAAAEDDRLEANVIVLSAEYDEAAGTIQVSSIVNNHIGEGTCTVTATSAEAVTHSEEVEALPDAQTTVCPTTMLEGVESGEWSVVVTFDSEEAAGSSEPTPVEVL